jgi:hypothetical protein
MTDLAIDQTQPGPAADPEPITSSAPTEPTAQCVCGHPVELHDVIASRYCNVTIIGDLKRGCICPAAAA